MKWLQQWQHALRVVESPAHISVGHYIDSIANDFADRAYQLNVSLHSFRAIYWYPAEPQLHRLVALVLVTLGFNSQLIQRHAVKTAGIDGNAFLRSSSQQPVHRL